MEFKTFTSLYAARLSIENLYGINKSTIEMAEPTIETIGGIPKAVLAHLQADNAAMGEQMKRAAANVLTAKTGFLDEDRDDRLNEVKRNVTMHIRGRDEVKKEAAVRLKIFLNPYWDTDDAAMNTQTAVLEELFAKFNQSDSLKADAITIGILEMMTGLQAANAEFDAVYKQRAALDAAAGGPSASSLKSAAAKSYEQFCTAMEQAVNFAPTPEVTTLFNQMDELRKTYARLIHRKEEAPESN